MAVKDDLSYLPSCWDDDVRMNSMFLNFRNKNVNPTAWQSKMSFWIEAVDKYCDVKSQILFQISDLQCAFKRNSRHPAPLETVLAEMRRQKTIVTYQEYVAQSVKHGWLSWGYNMAVRKPLSLGWNIVSSALIKKADSEGNRYLNLKILKKKAESLHCELKNCKKNVFHLDEVISISQELNIDSKVIELILIELKNKNFISMTSLDEGKYIKLIDENSQTEKAPTDEDLKFVRMKKIQTKLEEEIKKIENLITRHVDEAKLHLKNGSRSLAKNSLKKKKRYEYILSKKEIALENIQVLMNKIEEAESNRMIAEAYKAGVDAYKQKVATSGLQLENLDDVIASVQEVLGMHEEMLDTISTPVDSSLDLTTTDELERELAEIVAGEKNHEQKSDQSTSEEIEYPEVPSETNINDLEARLLRLRSSPPTGIQSNSSKERQLMKPRPAT